MIQVNLSNLRPRLWDRDYPIQSKLKKIMKLNPNKSNVEEKNWKNNLIKKRTKEKTNNKKKNQNWHKRILTKHGMKPRQREKREKRKVGCRRRNTTSNPPHAIFTCSSCYDSREITEHHL